MKTPAVFGVPRQAPGIVGWARFDASGATAASVTSSLSRAGVVVGVTYVSTGIFDVVLNGIVGPYTVSLLGIDDNANQLICYLNGTKAGVTERGFRFATVAAGSSTRNPSMVMINVFQ